MTHFSKNALLPLLNQQSTAVYMTLDKIFAHRLTKIKLNPAQALKILSIKFNHEVKDIYKVLKNFREGVNSYEAYSTQ